MLNSPSMHMYFKTIDVDIQEAGDLFRLIDIDESGSIDPEEFVNGCIRLQGPAKAIDLAMLMHEFKRADRLQRRGYRRMAQAAAQVLQKGTSHASLVPPTRIGADTGHQSIEELREAVAVERARNESRSASPLDAPPMSPKASI